MIDLAEATKIAIAYAKLHGFDDVQLVSKSYMYNGVMPSFAYQLVKNAPQNGDVELIGPPLMLLVDKLAGNTVEDRVLVS